MSSLLNAEGETEGPWHKGPVLSAESVVAQQRINVAGDPRHLPQLVDAWCQLALAHSHADDLETAADCYRDAIRDCEAAAIDVGPELGFRLFGLLGNVLDSARHDENCRLNYRMALSFAEKCKPCEALAVPIAGVHNNLGKQLLRCGEITDAVEHYRQALDVLAAACRDAMPPAIRQLQTVIGVNIGQALIELKDFGAARSHLANALASLRTHHGPHAVTPEIRRCFRLLQTAFEELGDADAANACEQRAKA